MEKKQYVKPSMKVYDMEPAKIICDSGGMSYIPTIPGQQDDEKHLA